MVSSRCLLLCRTKFAGSKTNETVSLSDNIPTQPLITSKQPKDLWKFLRTDKIFSNFCQKLLLKLKQSFDATMDFSSDIYKMFFQCNEIPLREILRDFCENNEDIVERILNQLELNEALQRYYYVKYLTNERFALKYPVKLKTTNSMEVLHISEESNKDELKKDESNCTNFEKTNITNAIKISDGQKVYNVPLSQGKKPMNNALEKAKRIFFRTVQKTNTLNYVLRTSFEGKQVILRTVLSLTFEEFLALTNVYEGDGLYDDNHIAECMYRYVFYNPMVWPTNLYIKLKDLCEFLFKKNIRFDNYSTMLVNISPKLLHWSALLSCTDFVNCVQFDYEKRTGKLLDTYDIKHLKEECIDYYDRCWKYDKWLGQVPLLCDEFCNNLPNDNNADDATTMLHESETTRDGGAANIELANVETTTELDNCATTDPEAPEFNCVLLPNTQQQIAMLPAEEDITDDPLNNSNNGTNLRVSSSENCGILQNIKTEPIDNEFLFNLLFFEDENGTIQCLSHEEEIIDLDNTLSTPAFEETLPPSQVDFGEAVLELSPSRVLVNSDSTSTSLSLAQKIPSSIEYGDNTICTQQFIQSPQSDRFTPTQQIQFPDINLFNSDEIEIHENVPENSQVLNVIDVMQKKKNICLQNSPSTATDSHISTRNLVAESDLGEEKSSECAKEIMDCVLASVGEQQPTNRAAKQNVGGCKINYPSGIFKPGLPIRTYQGIMQKKATTKRSNNIATVKPLKNTDLVPQIQHTIRPLQTIQAYSTDNPALRPVPQILAPTSLMLNLTPPSCDEASTGQSIGPNSNIQLQLSNLRGHIYISQELNNNCSVFDNTSLLRVIDHNYHKHASTNLSSSRITHSGSSESSQNSGIVEVEHHQLPTVITTNQASDQMGPVNNTLENNLKDTNENDSISQKANEEHDTCDSLLIATTTSANEQKSSARIVTFSTSRLYNTSDEVNNIILTHTNNIVASVKFTFYQPRGNFQNIIRKPCLYRNLIKLHYFKELTSQHIAKYLLPSLEIGKSYSEALVTCDNFRTRISNRSISVLFPFWSKNIQRDFLLVLRDLKEFHYNVYDRATMYNHEDLRARILYSLLHTAPAFSLCQFVYDINNSEFSYCEAINNGNNPSYKRKPFESLTNALSPNILGKLKQMKAELNSK